MTLIRLNARHPAAPMPLRCAYICVFARVYARVRSLYTKTYEPEGHGTARNKKEREKKKDKATVFVVTENIISDTYDSRICVSFLPRGSEADLRRLIREYQVGLYSSCILRKRVFDKI